jgi:hypothetical protein
MRTLFTWILLQLIVVCLTAQNSSDIYPKGWIDFSKNGKKDIYEDPSQSTEARISNLMGQMTKELFQDFQLHLEFKLPENENTNSGVYIQKRYASLK